MCDIKQDGFLDVNELGYSLLSFCTQRDNQILQLYELLDKDHNGYISEEQS